MIKGELTAEIVEGSVGVDCGCACVTGMLKMPPVAIADGNMKGEMDGADVEDKVASGISVVVVWRES